MTDGYGTSSPVRRHPAQAADPPGHSRSVAVSILLAVVTLGIYCYVWTYRTQREIKDHSGLGVGGGIGLLVYLVVAPVTFFLVANDVKDLYERRGQPAPVTALTGLWVLLPLAGPLVWFVKVQGALNDYWTASGTTAMGLGGQ